MTYSDIVSKYDVQMPPLVYGDAGVYSLECRPSGKSYIGCSKNILGRLARHVRMLRRGRHPNAHLQASWVKHGEQSFTFCVLEYTDDIYARERMWISSMDTFKSGLNGTSGGDGPVELAPDVAERKSRRLRATLGLPENRARRAQATKDQWAKLDAAERIALSSKISDAQNRESISARTKAVWDRTSTEDRTARAKKAWVGKTLEERSSITRIASLAAAAKLAAMTDDERAAHKAKLSAAVKKRYANRTPEQIAEQYAKAWATRRAKKQ